MSNTDKTRFLDMFPFCAGLESLCGGLSRAFVGEVKVNRQRMAMTVYADFSETAQRMHLKMLEDKIASQYGISSVQIVQNGAEVKAYPVVGERPDAQEKKAEKTAKSEKAETPKADKGKLIYGKAPKRKITAMNELTPESGSVAVTGDVFAVTSRAIARRDGWVLSFDITDNQGSIRVSKYFGPKDERGGLDTIKEGMCLTVYGTVSMDRYEQDICLQPTGVEVIKKRERMDKAEEKRVELHLHTRFSALDALTDPVEVIKRAAKWGHPAIAITDHGVAQAFPDAWIAGKKAKIKIIYGLEGYFVNDVDDKLAVYGQEQGKLSDEYVAFDIETTGLSAQSDRMTEVGAVIIRRGEIVESFESFVNPGMPVPPEITRLTGITDADVANAPNEEQVLRSFMEFIGERPLVAHNAEFDMGFMTAAARRCGIAFAPVYMDTLTLAQSLLPDMKRYKLDMVNDRLGLMPFNHHRASDDAAACGRIMAKFVEMLEERGITDISELQDLSRSERNENSRQYRTKHIILLVKDKVGLKNLYEIISKSHLEHFKKNPIIPKSLLLQYREGIIVGSACEAGEIYEAVCRHKSDEEIHRLAGMYDYLEIQPLCNNLFLIDNGSAKDEEELRDFNRRIVDLGKTLGKPVVATGDVHFLDPHQEIFRRILLAGKKFSDADKPMPIYFKTTDEMLEEFAYLGEETCRDVVIKNPNAIADMCQEIELLPKELFTPTIENSKEDLKRLVYERMTELYGENPPEIVKKRVETELGDIIKCHYDVIYMSAQKLVANSLEAGYLVGSRGSVGSSIVAYMSGITEVNALPAHYRCRKCKYADFESGKDYGCGADMPDKLCPVCGEPLQKDGFDIPFETFLGFGGDKIPDIDLNFSGEYQARAHKFTEELFGPEHVFKAGTIGTLAEKTAFGYVKNYLSERGKIVTKAEENRLALGCVGVKRTTGQHPGGLVIIPQNMDVTDFCPVQHPADDPNSDIITTHFDYHKMEDNLLKLDELGHDDPTMIKMLEDLTGVNAREIALDDSETRKIFCSPTPLGLPEEDPIIGKTGTIGIPEFGTAFTRQMLVDTKPDSFDTLIKLSGFSHGTDVWAGNIRELILSGQASISETVGCRDDIMLYLISKGMDPVKAFKFMETVRKGAIHKGRPWPEGIVEEMESLGVPEWYIESCRKIQYLFPKAHAVAYVMMAFRIAYFKVHYPLAYYSCYFYRRSDSFDAKLMTQGIDPVRRKLRELKLMEEPTAKDQDTFTTLEAVYEFYMRGFSFGRMDLYTSMATRFAIDGNTLIPPFVAIAGLGETAAADLERCREGDRRFISVEEVAAACPKVSKTHMEQLKALGALGDIPDTSQMSLF